MEEAQEGEVQDLSLSSDTKHRCSICGSPAEETYFGSLTCLACKRFFIVKESAFKCDDNGECEKDGKLKRNCAYCRYKRCLEIGMQRKEGPTEAVTQKGQELCLVCEDVSNGVHFGVSTCRACAKFFCRTIRKGDWSYKCLNDNLCVINPRTRNRCPRCRFNKCLRLGMSRHASKLGRPRQILDTIPHPDTRTTIPVSQEEAELAHNFVTFTMSANLGDTAVLTEKGSQNVDMIGRIIDCLIQTDTARQRVLNTLSYILSCPKLETPSQDNRVSKIAIGFNLTKQNLMALMKSLEKETNELLPMHHETKGQQPFVQFKQQTMKCSNITNVPAECHTGYGSMLTVSSFSSPVTTQRSQIASLSAPARRSGSIQDESYSGQLTDATQTSASTSGTNVPSVLMSTSSSATWYNPICRETTFRRYSPYASQFSPNLTQCSVTASWGSPGYPWYRTAAMQDSQNSKRYSRYSPVPTRFSQISTRYSPISTRYSPISTRYSPMSTRYSPVSTRYTPVSIQHSQTCSQYSSTSSEYSPGALALHFSTV